jgi:hypothetical protein
MRNSPRKSLFHLKIVSLQHMYSSVFFVVDAMVATKVVYDKPSRSNEKAGKHPPGESNDSL